MDHPRSKTRPDRLGHQLLQPCPLLLVVKMVLYTITLVIPFLIHGRQESDSPHPHISTFYLTFVIIHCCICKLCIHTLYHQLYIVRWCLKYSSAFSCRLMQYESVANSVYYNDTCVYKMPFDNMMRYNEYHHDISSSVSDSISLLLLRVLLVYKEIGKIK